jgi:group I intron endonuclease
MSGIYLITNTTNGNCYVGKTKNTPNKRFKDHIGKSKFGSSTVLAKAIRKYGVEAFKIELIEEVEPDKLDAREKFHIARLKPAYNMTEGGDGGEVGLKGSKWVNDGDQSFRIRVDEALPDGFVFGRLQSTKDNMRKEHAPMSDEGKENMRQARLKFRHTEESKQWMSIVRTEIHRLKKAHP